MNFCKLISPIFYNVSRNFNWKYPFPRELQPSPPGKEEINPENLIEVNQPLSANDKFNKEYINRNPRNLEQMLLEIKPSGYIIDAPEVSYWNKLILERSSKHITAKVVHNSGKTIISASTKEWSIRKHLMSTIDKTAIVSIAHIMAQRCLQSGIYFVMKDFSQHELQTDKVKLFLKTVEEAGLNTEELSAIGFKDEHYM